MIGSMIGKNGVQGGGPWSQSVPRCWVCDARQGGASAPNPVCPWWSPLIANLAAVALSEVRVAPRPTRREESSGSLSA